MIKHLKYVCLWLLCFIAGALYAAKPAPLSSIKPQKLRCEYLQNPMGLDEPRPRFSWTHAATDTNAYGQKQTAYRVVVSTHLISGEKEDKVWDSGWVMSSAMQQIEYKGIPLLTDRTYYWKVSVKDEKGRQSAWSSQARFTTGLLKPTDWKSKWIGTGILYDPTQADCNIPDPWLRKTISIKVKPGRAMFYVASVGYHEVYVNGRKVGNEVLAPAVTDNSKRARYIAYDIAPYLKAGNNVIALWLGSSWSIFSPYNTESRPNTPIVTGQCAIYRDKEPAVGAVPLSVVITDKTWKTHASPSRLLGGWDAGRMGGELWDDRLADDNWNKTGYNDSSWDAAIEYQPQLVLSAQQAEGNRLFTQIIPQSIEERKDGTYRVDMGVNFAGWTEVRVSGNAGDKVEFIYSEREAHDGTFGLHSTFIIGKNGTGTFRNRFNYSSGRWITIKGLKNKPRLSDIKGWLVRTAYPSATTFTCSDTLQNWIYNRVRWTYENLSIGGYIVDCPQRERLGYGGDAHATCETGLFNYDVAAFYTKWMEDWRDVKGTESVVGNMYDVNFARKAVTSGRHLHKGILPHSAPTYAGGGGPAWGGIVVSLPWFVYQHQGDKRILEKNYELINDWLLFLDTNTKDDLLQRFGGHWDFLGDWLWPGATAEGMNNDKPQTLCLNNCYRIFNLRTAAKIAHALGKTADAQRWEQQADASSRAVNAMFFNKDNYTYADGSMANLAAALLAEVPPANLRDSVFKKLETDILVKHKGHIGVGITGGAILFKVLRDAGRDDLIYSMTSQTGYPGWGHMKANGATSIWEMWEKDLPGHSLMHSSFLYPGAWYIDGVAGIRRNADHPGFQHFIIRLPLLKQGQINWAKTTFDSPAGLIKTAWDRNGNKVTLNITVPPNCTALIDTADSRPDVIIYRDSNKKQPLQNTGNVLAAGRYTIVTTGY